MTNHPIAEQDSLERLIARLRSSAKAYRGMLHDSHGNDCDEAADTLCQMREENEGLIHDLSRVMERENRFLNALIEIETLCHTETRQRLLAICEAALGTTTKIEKSA